MADSKTPSSENKSTPSLKPPSTQKSRPIITPELIQEYLDTEDDFGFEQSTLHLLNQMGDTQCEHGETYIDPVTSVRRQFDIRASIKVNDGHLFLAIECKNLGPTFPLVISRVPRLPHESFHEAFHAPSGNYLMGVPYRKRHTDGLTIYHATSTVGKSLKQIGIHQTTNEWVTKGDDMHEKWSQAIASGHDLVHRAHSWIRNGKSKQVAIMPVLVVPNGMLFSCEYGANGARIGSVIPNDSVEVFLNHKVQHLNEYSYTFSHLHVVTQQGLKRFVGRIRGAQQFDQLFPID